MTKKLIGFINLTKCKEANFFKTKQLQVEKDAQKVYIGSLKEPQTKQAEPEKAPEQSEKMPWD